MNDNLDDTVFWAGVSAEELTTALLSHGIRLMGPCEADDEGDVFIFFIGLKDAETLAVLGLDSNGGPGSMYDRATSGCVTMKALDVGDSEADAKAERAIHTGWHWEIHPNMSGRRMDWHCRVLVPAADARQLTATLNALTQGGAL